MQTTKRANQDTDHAHRLRICITDPASDFALIKKLAKSGEATSWPCVKATKRGDQVLLYMVYQRHGFVASAKVIDDARWTRDSKSRPLRARIGHFRLLPVPLLLSDIRRHFPEWGWPRYPRIWTSVPDKHAERLWTLAHIKPGSAVGHPHSDHPTTSNSRPRPRAKETRSRAETFHGDKLYQQRARAALPLLVDLAARRETIYYGNLAKALNMDNPRTLNYVLGSIGQTLFELRRKWKEAIPPIQCLVINQSSHLPGEGVGFFIDKKRFKTMSKSEQRRIVEKVHRKIWAYRKWEIVLSDLSLHPATDAKARVVRRKGLSQGGGYGNPKENKLVEAAAVRRVIKGLRKLRYRVKSREKERIGYDLDAIKSDEVLHIEVKGVSGGLAQFQITSGEVNRARSDPAFRLFVVTRARTRTAEIHQFSGTEFKDRFHLDPSAYRATLI